MPALSTLSTQKSSPKWTFRGKHTNAESKSATPGPGAYTPIAPDGTSGYKKASRIIFGSSTRDERKGNSAMPGPGQYTPRFQGTSKTSPRFGFGTSVRAASSRYSTPGPGAYNSSTSMGGEAPKYSIRARTNKDALKSNNPGPGAYSPPAVSSGAFAGSSKAVMAGSPKWGFGTANRNQGGGSGSKGTPGPGAYDQKKVTAAAPSYSMRGRHADMSSRTQTPGPGAHGDVYSQFI